MKVKLRNVPLGVVLAGLIAVVMMFGMSAGNVRAHEADPHPHAEDSKAAEVHPDHGATMGQVGAKLANPLSELWSLSFDFQPFRFFDGDVNRGDEVLGGGVTFQPVMPIPLFGEGDAEWRMITRPIIPIQFSQPIPRGYNNFYNKGGIGDIQLPLLLSVPEKYAGHWILGAGPVTLFPTASDDALGSDQFGLGPAVVLGYKTKNLTAGIFPNYFWKVGSHGQDRNTPDISQGSMLYFFNYMLQGAWQVGCNPTITYNDKASSGNKWNVPIGLYVGKTIKAGNIPLNLKFGIEHSVVSEDDFGKRTIFRIQITPVIKSLIQNPIFGK